MVIRTDSKLYKLLALMPIHVSPYQLKYVRVGTEYCKYVAITWRKF